MKILKLERTEVGVIVTYKKLFKTRKREAVRDHRTGSVVWADNGELIFNSSSIVWFEKSKLESYALNGA